MISTQLAPRQPVSARPSPSLPIRSLHSIFNSPQVLEMESTQLQFIMLDRLMKEISCLPLASIGAFRGS